MVRAADGAALAAGRFHLNSPAEAQVRFMAVDPGAQGRGLGGLVLKNLEDRAREAGAKLMVLNAREAAVRFYEERGYWIKEPAGMLFGEIEHFRMHKSL